MTVYAGKELDSRKLRQGVVVPSAAVWMGKAPVLNQLIRGMFERLTVRMEIVFISHQVFAFFHTVKEIIEHHSNRCVNKTQKTPQVAIVTRVRLKNPSNNGRAEDCLGWLFSPEFCSPNQGKKK